MEIEHFRSLVFADPELTEKLSRASTESELIAMVQQHCGDLSVTELQQMIKTSRTLWLERWLER